MKNFLRSMVVLFALAITPAFAQQSNPNWTFGYVPSPAEWNFWFGKKVDWQGAAYCPVTGCTMTGPLLTAASTTLSTGFNIPPGVAPTTPNNGDIWETTSGIFAQINGVTVQLAVTSPSGSIITSNSANALAVGPNGATNPSFNVDASTASAATGLNVKSAAAGAGVALSAISSATNEAISINAKGSGNILIGNISTGSMLVSDPVTITAATSLALAVGANGSTNPQLQIDASTASVATGLLMKGAAAGGGYALSLLSSGSNENLTIDGKGTGFVKIASVSTGGFGFNVGSDATADTYYRGSNGLLVRVPIGSNSQVLTISSGVPSWQPGAAAASINVGTTTITGTCGNTQLLFNNSGTTGCETLVPAANGGTGVASPTAHALMIAEGSSAMANTGVGTVGQFVGGNGASADPSFLSGPKTLIKTTNIPANVTVTFTNGSAVIGGTNSYVAGQLVQLTTTGALPTNFATTANYFVSATGLSGSQFELATTPTGTPIVAGSAGSGTQTSIASGILDATSLTATYSEYEINLDSCTTASATSLLMILNISGVWQIANYNYGTGTVNTSGTFSGAGGTAAVDMLITPSSASLVNIKFWISNPASTSNLKTITAVGSANSTVPSISFGGLYTGGNGAVQGLEIYSNTAPNAMTACTLKVYGSQ